MIAVEEGGEYRGERYIWCTVCTGNSYPVRDGEGGLFEGTSFQELQAFIAQHQHS